MKRLLSWVWSRGILSTFAAGLMVVLPIALTIAVIAWISNWLQSALGPGSAVGNAARSIGLNFSTNEVLAYFIGTVLVLIAVWVLGLLVRWGARYHLEGWVDRTMNRIPVIKSIYGPVSQIVGMMKKPQEGELKGMSVVYCAFSDEKSGGFLALLASTSLFQFEEEPCRLVYIPTSPLPMTGGLIFVPDRLTKRVSMKVEELMQVYFSLGIVAGKTIPEGYRKSRETA